MCPGATSPRNPRQISPPVHPTSWNRTAGSIWRLSGGYRPRRSLVSPNSRTLLVVDGYAGPDPGGRPGLNTRAISRSLSVTAVTLGSHELESPHPVAADPFCGFLDGVHVLEAE